MKIEAYAFGTITVDGRTYTRDLKIIAGRVVPDWWRKEGHNLLPEDIEDVIEAKPGVLVVGTGHDGMMRISRAVEDRLARAHHEVVEFHGVKAERGHTQRADTGWDVFDREASVGTISPGESVGASTCST